MKINRKSPYSGPAVDFVTKNPGCSKMELARYLTYNQQRDPSKQYYLVNTQLRLGNLVAEFSKGKYSLSVNPEIINGN